MSDEVTQEIVEYSDKRDTMLVKSKDDNVYEVSVALSYFPRASRGYSSSEEYIQAYDDIEGKTGVIDTRRWNLVRIKEDPDFKKGIVPEEVEEELSPTFNYLVISDLIENTQEPTPMGTGGEMNSLGLGKKHQVD